MRYTSIIDISEYQSLYRNQAVRLVYLHLVLKAGYHDDDRDLCQVSLRTLARDVGLTLSATRHALSQLQQAGLLEREGPVLKVKKWVYERPISPRPKNDPAAAPPQNAVQLEMNAEREKKEAEERAAAARREKLVEQGKNSWMVYYEERLKAAEAGDPDAIAYVKQHAHKYTETAAAMAFQRQELLRERAAEVRR